MLSLAIALAVGGASALLTRGQMDIYETAAKPPLAPPGVVFPIVWTILFLLMGVTAYLIYISRDPKKGPALLLYGVQLVVNFFWPLLFFSQQYFAFAFFWLVLLWVLILWMVLKFREISPLAAWLQVPYLLWVAFAGYLNYWFAFVG